MTRDEIFARATDSTQYDSSTLDWPSEGSLPSPAMQPFRRSLRPELGDLSGKSVIDIGCGTGHLYTLFEELGARTVTGLEPSARNVAQARREFPKLALLHSSLADARPGAEFDVAVAVMSFEHQPDLRDAFRRVFGMLRPGGAFHLIFGDMAFHLTPRLGLRLESHEMPDGSVVIATGYPYGTIHDVIRPREHYERAARLEGFEIVRCVEMLPTPELFDVDPRWRDFASRPMAHLMVMRKPGR